MDRSGLGSGRLVRSLTSRDIRDRIGSDFLHGQERKRKVSMVRRVETPAIDENGAARKKIHPGNLINEVGRREAQRQIMAL